MQGRDVKGYYATLGVAPGANEDDIKAAYRRRAMELHPDRNPEVDTTEPFQALNEAYEVLSDPVARTAYDNGIAAQPTATQAQAAPEPIACSRCGKVSAQPRVVVFKTVKSFVLFTVRKPVAGVFCSGCARNQSVKASAVTWLLGWWGFPWGPIYSLQELLTNLFGGTFPALENGRMLAYQAHYFQATGRPDIARSVAESALKYCKKIPRKTGRKADNSERDSLIAQVQAFIDHLGTERQGTPLKNSWNTLHGSFYLQLAAMAIAAVGVAVLITLAPSGHSTPPRGPMPYSAEPIAATNRPAQVTSAHDAVAKAPAYVRPASSPNGKPWPKAAGYLLGEPQTHTDGYSEVTVDNTRNDSDVYVKLVSLSGNIARPARQVYIPAHASFTIKTLASGTYDVRYRDLTTGGLARSEPMSVSQTTTSEGIRYDTITLTLYKVANGNMKTYRLADDEF